MNRLFRIAAITLLLLSAAGCATIDYDYPRTESYFLPDTSDTYLGKEIEPDVAQYPPDQSGFYPINDGVEALAARLLMAQRAEKSIDVQYYLIKNDIVGRAFIYVLLLAADNGVRVRLLLDDMFTSGYDVGMAALHSHPNFEIRIFNPFHRGAAGRAKSAVTGFGRINRRMHNKSFTVDNQITIIGGRNIADEYFGAREDAKFGDLDVVGVGPVVQDVSNMFDTYWNHPTALPVPAFVNELEDPEAELNALRLRLADSLEDIRESKYAEAVRSKVLAYIETDAVVFEWATYSLVVDSPDKGIKAKAQEADSITTPLIGSLNSAERELIILSPYFVPLKDGIEGLVELQRRGVQVTVITNSLAANNQFTVHGGYAPSRKPLLEAGVKIYEMRPDADVEGTEFIDASGAKATLHTKAFIVDDREVFIGSFNFDPRSANLNTELGVIIRDPELALVYTVLIEEALPKQTFEVFLNEKGKLRWRGFEDGEEVIYDKEPETTWGQRTMAWFARIIPKSQL
ncbi:MAG: phospholipase D family protein [Gammaproteobacteria bacterium]|jgi:putative cardiolipin synthase|nr:phospholipase D family protein [Gammaproteobacteria bacterium]